ncbi:MAG: TlpA disulfide reductase family protein [Vicingaceae bacterium]
MKLLSILFCCLLCFPLFSAETVVQGNINGFDTKTIKLAVVEDFITSNKKYIAESTIQEGSFKLVIKLEEVQQLFLKVEDKESSFFAEPGKVYNLLLSYDLSKNEGRAYNKILDLKMAYPKAGELNQKIKSFNGEMRDFFAENHEKFIVKNASKEIENFIGKMEAEEKYQSPAFVENYVRYALANLKDINQEPKKALFESYLQGQDVLYHHKEYMNFFLQFFQEDFGQFCITKEGAKLLRAIMFEKDMEQSLKLIEAGKSFKQRALAELYFINGLFEVYHKKTIEQESNLAMLTQLSEKASNPEARQIAKSVLNALEAYGKEQVAPAFSLYNQKGELLQLSDFKGKPVYLNFWADWSIPSLKQLSVLKKLHQDYGDKIHFVSINLDEDPEKMNQIIADRELKWTFLHYNNDYEIREKYQVKAVPSYYLIDENGKMLNAYAPGPVEIERKLYQMSQQ